MLEAINRNSQSILKWDVESRLKSTSLQLIKDTEYVIVSGRELSWVINSFVNLPHHRTEDPQIFAGDFAKFIVGHLPAEDGQQ